MLRSILVALDGSSSSVRASQLALQLGREYKSHVEGIGIVNSGWIQRVEPVPIGGLAIKSSLDHSRMKSAKAKVDEVSTLFRSMCTKEGLVSFSARAVEGDPAKIIADEATAHDLVVLGRDSVFDVDGELEKIPLCVDKIIREEPRPVLIVPESDADAPIVSRQPVIVAFDGSPASSRALHMFALLGMAAGRTIHVLTVAGTSDWALRTAMQASQLLERHGAADVKSIGLGDREAGTPSETVLGLTKSLGAGMIVMGAYGNRGIREIFGSTTREILKESPAVLFLHH